MSIAVTTDWLRRCAKQSNHFAIAARFDHVKADPATLGMGP